MVRTFTCCETSIQALSAIKRVAIRKSHSVLQIATIQGHIRLIPLCVIWFLFCIIMLNIPRVLQTHGLGEIGSQPPPISKDCAASIFFVRYSKNQYKPKHAQTVVLPCLVTSEKLWGFLSCSCLNSFCKVYARLPPRTSRHLSSVFRSHIFFRDLWSTFNATPIRPSRASHTTRARAYLMLFLFAICSTRSSLVRVYLVKQLFQSVISTRRTVQLKITFQSVRYNYSSRAHLPEKYEDTNSHRTFVGISGRPSLIQSICWVCIGESFGPANLPEIV